MVDGPTIYYKPPEAQKQAYLDDPDVPNDVKDVIQTEGKIPLNNDPFQGSYVIHFARKKRPASPPRANASSRSTAKPSARCAPPRRRKSQGSSRRWRMGREHARFASRNRSAVAGSTDVIRLAPRSATATQEGFAPASPNPTSLNFSERASLLRNVGTEPVGSNARGNKRLNDAW